MLLKPLRNRTTPHNKEFSGPNVNSTEVEKFWVIGQMQNLSRGVLTPTCLFPGSWLHEARTNRIESSRIGRGVYSG